MAGWVTHLYPGGSVQVETGNRFEWRQQPCKLVLHTTEGSSWPDYGYNKASHVTIDPNKFRWRQHQPLDQPAWTLKAPVGAVSTNSMGAIQIEIVGYAATMKNLDGPQLAYLIGFIKFILAQTGIPATCTVPFGGIETIGVNGAHRMSAAAWTAYRGILGHQHVPNNDHWDPGDLPMQSKWLPLIQRTGDKPTPPIPLEDDMDLILKASDGSQADFIFPGWTYLVTDIVRPLTSFESTQRVRNGAKVQDVKASEILDLAYNIGFTEFTGGPDTGPLGLTGKIIGRDATTEFSFHSRHWPVTEAPPAPPVAE